METETIKRTINLSDIIEQALGPGKHSGSSTLWPCPFHDEKTPSLSVKRDADFFKCFGCGKSGDVFTWLQEYEGMTFIEAFNSLGGTAEHPVVKRQAAPPKALQAPAQDWQEKAAEITHTCKDLLWKPAGKKALNWLHDRGLQDWTIETWDIGYSQGMNVAGVYVEPGIIIPGYDGDRYWYIKIRRASGDPKYRKVKGSSNGYFGQPPRIYWSQEIFLTEGEFDCMLLWQECYEITNVGTFGSATDRVDPATWGAALSCFEKIFTVYDLDAAGQGGSLEIVKRTGRARRCALPASVAGKPVKDITDYYLAGGDLKAWAWYQINGGAR